MNNYDKINIPLFRTGNSGGYLCSMCGQYTTLSDSTSYRGYNMICNHCLYKMAHIFDKSVGDLVLLIHEEGKRREE